MLIPWNLVSSWRFNRDEDELCPYSFSCGWEKIIAHEIPSSKQDTSLCLSEPRLCALLQSTPDLLLRDFLPYKTSSNFCPLKFPLFSKINWWHSFAITDQQVTLFGETIHSRSNQDDLETGALLVTVVNLWWLFCAAAGLFTLCTSRSHLVRWDVCFGRLHSQSPAFLLKLLFVSHNQNFWSTSQLTYLHATQPLNNHPEAVFLGCVCRLLLPIND